MSDFFRFPHTPHIAWLADGSPRDDKILLDHEVAKLLAGEVVVEEKLDGANLGLSLDEKGELRAQNRGHYLTLPYSGQFSRLVSWLAQHQHTLVPHMTSNLMLFGEWCAARHSINYAALPDWFLLFDVYDTKEHQFWSTTRRNELAAQTGLSTVPRLHQGSTTLTELKQLVAQAESHYRTGPLEGVVVRRENAKWCEAKAKLVRPDFTQAIAEHWSRRGLEWNQLDKKAWG